MSQFHNYKVIVEIHSVLFKAGQIDAFMKWTYI